MRRRSQRGLGPDETILREGRIHVPLHRWILAPLLAAAFLGGIVAASSYKPDQAPYMAALGIILGLLFVLGTRSWRWRITEYHLQQGNLGWPVFRFASRTGLAGVTSVHVLTGPGIRREVKIHLGDGPLYRWHRGAVILRLHETVDAKNVIGTDTAAEAEDLAAFLRERVAAATAHTGYTPPADRNVRVTPSAQNPEQPS